MGKTSFHKHMFFKFQSSQTQLIPYYRKVGIFVCSVVPFYCGGYVTENAFRGPRMRMGLGRPVGVMMVEHLCVSCQDRNRNRDSVNQPRVAHLIIVY